MSSRKTKAPFLSVVVPTYNRRDSLKLTLKGLASQTYPRDDFEVIVVSDGATDGTDAFLAEFAPTAPYRLRPITQENAGPARARNRGVQEACGAVIVFLDDDVEPAPGFLAAHASYHARDDKIALIGPMSPAPERDPREPPWIAWEHATLEKKYDNWRTGVWPGAGPNHFYSGNASLRRAHLLAVGGFDESFNRQEDVELAYRLERQCGLRFHFEPAACGWHRPSRTFESWLNVPYSYGRLDVVRARRGAASWDVVRGAYLWRNRATRMLASWALRYPGLHRPLRRLLFAAARVAYRGRLSAVSVAALSVIYNLRYLEGAQVEIGTVDALRRLIAQEVPPVSL